MTAISLNFFSLLLCIAANRRHWDVLGTHGAIRDAAQHRNTGSLAGIHKWNVQCNRDWHWDRSLCTLKLGRSSGNKTRKLVNIWPLTRFGSSSNLLINYRIWFFRCCDCPSWRRLSTFASAQDRHCQSNHIWNAQSKCWYITFAFHLSFLTLSDEKRLATRRSQTTSMLMSYPWTTSTTRKTQSRSYLEGSLASTILLVKFISPSLMLGLLVPVSKFEFHPDISGSRTYVVIVYFLLDRSRQYKFPMHHWDGSQHFRRPWRWSHWSLWRYQHGLLVGLWLGRSFQNVNYSVFLSQHDISQTSTTSSEPQHFAW